MTQDFSRFDSGRLIENREMRIFLSSTFMFMEKERTALLKLFDNLRLKANRRNVKLSVIDLRWGVTDEEARSGKVLSICLEEIERSHPFFIGLLGNHYGTSLNISELERNSELEERYPWIRKDLEEGMSVTEIEMQYGALRNSDDVDAVFFFNKMPGTPTDDSDKLTLLKRKIREDSRFHNDDYISIEDLCVKVENTISIFLDKEFPIGESSRLDRERTAQKAYLNANHGHYHRLQADYDRLDSFVSSSETHLVITGPSGRGKSALIANWLKDKEKTQDELPYNLIYHFVGNSFSGSDYRQILQHVCNELYDKYNLERHENLSERIEEESQRILVDAGQVGKPLLIVIDGINQIIDQNFSKTLTWLPQAPQTTKYIFSTLEEDKTMETFKRLNYTIYTIGKLDRDSRQSFIINYLYNVGKKLTQAQIDRILDNTLNENMLVLRTLLDELICFGSHKHLDKRIDYYLSANSIDGFFELMLQRLDNDYQNVPRILSAIALSENGMTQEELHKISGARPMDFHFFLSAFYNHLVVRNGLITFAHQYVTDAVWKYLGLNDPEKSNPFRQLIINNISNNSLTTRKRKIFELAFQYYHTNNDEKLHKTILSFEAFRYFDDACDGDIKLASYWRKLLQNASGQYQLRNYIDLDFRGIDIKELPYIKMGYFIEGYFGDLNTAWKYYATYLRMCLDYGCDTYTLSSIYNNMGFCCLQQGNYPLALEFYQKIVTNYATYSCEAAICFNNMGMVYKEMNNHLLASKFFFKAKDIFEKLYGSESHYTSYSYNNIGALYEKEGDYDKAILYLRKALDIREKIFGEQHQLTATVICNIGTIYDDMGDFGKALDSYNKALAINLTILGKKHPSIATIYGNIAWVYYRLGEHQQALNYYDKALSICENILGLNHPDTISIYKNISLVYYKTGNYSKAKEYNYVVYNYLFATYGPDHQDTIEEMNNIEIIEKMI